MKPPCMIVTAHILPAVRVVVARNLIEFHEMKPSLVASKMGLTPAAVTQYVSGVRGGMLAEDLQQSEGVKQMVNRIVGELLKIESDTSVVTEMLCELCRITREERLLCRFCDHSEKMRNRKDCDMCSKVSRC